MKNEFSYPATLTKQREGGYLVRFPDLPEAITQGDSIEHALNEAIDCLEEAIANRMVNKLDVPEPKLQKKGQYIVSLDVTFVAKMALLATMQEQKISNTLLAKKMHCDEKEIRRLLDPQNNSKFPRIEKALNTLGKKIKVKIVSCG